jgi:hypothetical protein
LLKNPRDSSEDAAASSGAPHENLFATICAISSGRDHFSAASEYNDTPLQNSKR